MNFDGIIIGVATFLIIGVCHPLVIKAEYYFGVKSAWAFLAIGILFLALSLMVLKGWFPKNPKRLDDYVSG